MDAKHVVLSALLGSLAGIGLERRRKTKLSDLPPPPGPAVINEDIMACAKPLCRACRGRGRVRHGHPDEALCRCALARFKKRWSRFCAVGTDGDLYWKTAGGKPKA